MTVRVWSAVVVAGVLLLAGCSSMPATFSGPSPAVPSAGVSAPGGERPTFEACGRGAGDLELTNLRPSELTAADRASVAASGVKIPDGRLVLEHVTDLVLPLGSLGFGDGYSASLGGLKEAQLREVAAPGTVAPVTLAVLDSPSDGRRVAFVEVRVGQGVPVRWEEGRNLGFVTDGGDGGVWVPAFRGQGEADVEAAYGAIEAMYPDGDSASGNVCVLRSTSAGVDGVVFSAGYGDGGYPTFVGFDAAGAVVSVVSVGFVVPWELSGLPGVPPDGMVP